MIIKAPFYEVDSYLFVYYNQTAASGSGNDKDTSAYCFVLVCFKFAKGSVFIAECRETCKQAEHALMAASPAFEWQGVDWLLLRAAVTKTEAAEAHPRPTGAANFRLQLALSLLLASWAEASPLLRSENSPSGHVGGEGEDERDPFGQP